MSLKKELEEALDALNKADSKQVSEEKTQMRAKGTANRIIRTRYKTS